MRSNWLLRATRAGEFFLAAADRFAGVHGRQQAALHEFGEGRQTGDALFAQFLDALHDQAVIGARGAEAEGGAGHGVFDLGSQGGQRGEDVAFILGAAGLADAVHHVGQFLFRRRTASDRLPLATGRPSRAIMR